MGGTPATVVSDTAVTLERDRRADREAVLVEQRRIFG
jgi:hypothetical protein